MPVAVAQFEREMIKERQVEASKERKLKVSTKGEYQRPCGKQTSLRLWSLLVLIG